MQLLSAQVTRYKSIDDSGAVPIDAKTTVLVGQNEAGKTAFLQALYQSNPVFSEDQGFDVTEEYPRKDLTRFEDLHPNKKAIVSSLRYQVDERDVQVVNDALGIALLKPFQLGVKEEYQGPGKVEIAQAVNESVYVKHLLKDIPLPESIAQAARAATSIKALIALLDGKDLTAEGDAFLKGLHARFGSSGWENVLEWELWEKYLALRVPRFFYFDDYRLLPGKANLNTLHSRVQSARANKALRLTGEEQAVLALLQMARVNLDELLKQTGYESARAKLEGVSNRITDQIFKYWRQNKTLEVVVDIRDDPTDVAPFNNGPNLYIRIKNQRHRVTVPFSQRSKGFIWFFSFLVWFDSVKQRAIDAGGAVAAPLILLLDEPGLSLHALAQADLLRYIDDLATQHQVIYTTHSPFMVHSDRLVQVRVVEDRDEVGTKVFDRVDGSDSKTLFPLQAALGYTVAQNLFIAKRNLVVEGVADLAYLQFFSAECEASGREALRTDVVITPVGGLDKIATFVALLGANALELVVVSDYSGRSDARLDSLIREKILREKQLVMYAAFRDGSHTKSAKGSKATPGLRASDIEDLISPKVYVELFNRTFEKELGSKQIKEADLPPGDRIVERVNQWLEKEGVELRPSGGYNHYAVAKTLVSSPAAEIDDPTLDRFAALFKSVNARFSNAD